MEGYIKARVVASFKDGVSWNFAAALALSNQTRLGVEAEQTLNKKGLGQDMVALRTLLLGNTQKTRDVMPEEIPPLWRSLIWGLQVFAACAPATVVGVLTINKYLADNGVTTYQFDPLVALVAAGLGTIVWTIVTAGLMPNFVGTSFTYIAAIVSVSVRAAKVVPSGVNPLAYATGAVVQSTLVTLSLALLVYLITKRSGANKAAETLAKIVPKVVAANIIVNIGLSLAGVGTGMAQTNLVYGIATILLILVFRFIPGYLGTIPIVLAIGVVYLVGAISGQIDVRPVINAPLFRMPGFFLPRFDLASLVQMIPVCLATSFETLGHILVLQGLLNRPLMDKLWRALLGDALADPAGGMVGTAGNTTYAEGLGVFALVRVFSTVVVLMAAFWSIAFGFSGHLNAFLSSIMTAILGGAAVVMFGSIAVQGFELAIREHLNFRNIKNFMVTAVMQIVGVGNLKLVFRGEEWLSGISFSIVLGLVIYYFASFLEKRYPKLTREEPEFSSL
ncbi:MAG: Uracil permease [Microgenomates group bacterium ADurb.Bin219]|nr:MAG: Uracil permease [Microgenomates group bacterium ADurb.Bin219]HNP89128.1 solute carrier family 23 protein [Candidatus Woesebacteria bacterium]